MRLAHHAIRRLTASAAWMNAQPITCADAPLRPTNATARYASGAGTLSLQHTVGVGRIPDV